MKSALLVIPFLLVGLVPVAFGQVVETTGQNYDLIEDFTIGEAKWTSHPERIMVNGEWENYFLQANDQQIIFRSNSVGGFIYDIPSCSYSIYENGFDGNQIIPSVSSVASYNVNGNWQNMAVNQEECLVNFSQGDNGIFITSTKTLFGEINQPIFQSYNGTDSTVSVNGTSYNVISNGNQTGYYVDNFVNVETEKFVQELKVDIFGGIKETFKVWNESDEPLGISQTVHTGESITIGENTLNIAELNGQSFSKQFLEDNQAQVFEIANGLNYDFDLGFDSLSNINIFYDGDYKVNLDYANGGFVNYLEIDPTFTSSASTIKNLRTDGNTGDTDDCSVSGSPYPYWSTGAPTEQNYMSSEANANGVCLMPTYEFDISSITDSNVITNVQVKFDVTSASSVSAITGFEWVPIDEQIDQTSSATNALRLKWEQWRTETAYVTNTQTTTGTNIINDLGSNAVTELQSALTQDWFTISSRLDPFDNHPTLSPSMVLANVELQVTYSLPTIPQPPTNLQTVTGIPIELSWTAPVDDGGSSLTGYKVYRTLNQYVMTELPNNGGTTGVDFIDNELLLHGESLSSTTPDNSPNTLTVTATSGTTTTGVISNAISTPNLEVTSSLLPDGTDSFTVGSWVKQAINTPELDTDFSSATGWTSGSTSSFEVTNNELQMKAPATLQYISYDLGSLSTSNWIIRYDIEWSGTQSNNPIWWVTVSSSPTSVGNTNHDGLNALFYHGSNYKISTNDGNRPDQSGTQTDLLPATAVTNTIRYIEMIRDGSNFTVNIYSDSNYSTLVTSKTLTIASGITGLQYFKVINYNQGSGITGNIDNLVFYNGVSSVSTTPTNTKLFGFTNSNGQDVAFNVGTTTADFKVNTTPIISATGLTDNTSDFQHYAVTRDGSSWTLYQNGQSVATATDSTDLGSASGQTSLVYDQQTNNNNQSLYSGVQHISAERFGTGSSIVGQKITNVSLLLAIHSGSPTGTATVGAFDSSGNTLHTFGTIDVTTLTGTPTWYDFTNNSGYTVQTDDYIGIKYTGGDSNNRINTFLDYLNNPFEGTTSYWGRYAVTTWQDYTTSDLTMKLTATNDPVYSINLDGSIDEYFIDSTALTSNEIETVYGMGSEPTQIATTGTTPSYDDSGVTGGNTYYYYVKATNAIGDSDFSTQVSGLAGTPPDAPTGLSASIQNTNTAPRDIFLQWSAPTNVGSGTLTGFEIWRDGSLVTTVGLVSSYVDIVPTVGTYTYTVKAVSTHGTSVDSNSAQITTPNLPDAPQGLTLSIDNPDPSPLTVTVTVSPPLNDGGSAVGSYNIYTSSDDITYTLQASNVSNPSNITVPSAGLWYFKASAVNGVGEGALSNNAIIGTPNVPDAPTSVTTNIPDVNNAPSSVVVAWSNGLTNGGSAITGYNVYRDGSLLTSLGTGIFTYTDTATKTASTSYTYEVRITNNVGESLGTQSSITTPSPPNAPVLSVETGTTKATWTIPTSDATITNYKLYRDGSLVATVSGSTTTYIDRTLITFGNSYDYQISAVSSIGEGALSNTVTTTPDTNVDDATAFGTTGTSSIIDWTEPPYFQGEVTSYSVYYSTPYSSNPSTLIGTTGNTYLNLYNQLQYDTNYAFMVLVNSPLGNTSVGNVVNATTTENLGIVTFDPTTGSDWFDIDAVNQEELNLTTYTRTEGNGGTLLGVTYPTNYESMTCDINYRFGQETLQYTEGEDITATPIDAAKQLMVFQFNNQDSEVIYIECADQSVPNSASSYTLTTTFGNFPLLTQIDNFRSGEYGTEGLFGSLDLITLFVVIISMVGFNRVSPIAGVIIGVSALLGMAYFEITSLPATLIGVFALIAFLAWGVTRK